MFWRILCRIKYFLFILSVFFGLVMTGGQVTAVQFCVVAEVSVSGRALVALDICITKAEDTSTSSAHFTPRDARERHRNILSAVCPCF